jgi:DNA-binding winged helix-turn-helix (wHTH) protein
MAAQHGNKKLKKHDLIFNHNTSQRKVRRISDHFGRLQIDNNWLTKDPKLPRQLSRECTAEKYRLMGTDIGIEIENTRRRFHLTSPTMASFRFGPFQLNPDQTLWEGDTLVHLSPMQRRMLHCFCRHPKQVLSKNQLMQDVWGHQEVSEVSLARTVHGLRRKLAETKASGDLIRNVYAEGYIFTQNVEELSGGSPSRSLRA